MNTNKISENKIVQIDPYRTRRTIHTETLMMAVWDFSNGPWEEPEPSHSHPQDQIAYLAEGEVLFFIGDKSCHLKSGDTIAVPGDQPHTIQLLTPTVRIIDTWTPVRQDFL